MGGKKKQYRIEVLIYLKSFISYPVFCKCAHYGGQNKGWKCSRRVRYTHQNSRVIRRQIVVVAKKSDEACTGEHHAQYQQYDNYCPIATDISDNEEEDARWDATCESDGETCTNFKYWIIIKEREESGGKYIEYERNRGRTCL